MGTVASATTTIFVEESPPPPTVVDMERLNDLLPQFDVPAASLSTRASAVLAAAPVEQTISVEPGDATIGTASVCVRLSEPTGGSSAACEPGRSVGFLLGISVTPGDPQNSTIYLAHESTVTVSTDACKVASAPVSDSVSVAACDLADLIGDVELDIVTGAATYRVSVTVPDLDSFKPVGAP